MTTLTMKDEKRLDVIQRVYRSELTVGQAAPIVGLSERQFYRVKARVNKVTWDHCYFQTFQLLVLFIPHWRFCIQRQRHYGSN